MPTTSTPVVVTERAVEAVHDLARLTRPAITELTTTNLYDLTGALSDVVTALPQVLNQLAGYPAADAARNCLAHASRIRRTRSRARHHPPDPRHQRREHQNPTLRGSIFNRRKGVNFRPSLTRSTRAGGVDGT